MSQVLMKTDMRALAVCDEQFTQRQYIAPR